MTCFSPPMRERTTKELLTIVDTSEKWITIADQARIELKLRNSSQEQIDDAKCLLEKVDKCENLKRAKESYTVSDFIFEPVMTIFEVLVSRELEKDGYLRKASQQKRLRIIIGLGILTAIIYSSGIRI